MYHAETHLEGDFRGVPVIGGRPERNSTTVYIAGKPELPLRPVTRLELLQAHREYWLKKTRENEAAPAEYAVRGLQRTLADLEQRRPGDGAQLEQKRQKLLEQIRGWEERPVVVVDDDFHTPRPDPAAVQYITVFWRRTPNSAVKERAMDALLNNLDFNALRALLDR